MNIESIAEQCDDEYRSKLCRLVSREMNERFRRREDPEDVVQSAFRTFYRRNALGEFHFDSTADLWPLLATITRRKILKHAEKMTAGRRGLDREECRAGEELCDASPSPEEVAIAADLVERTLDGLDESYAAVFHGRLQNCTETEIAEQLGCTRALVRVKIQRIRDRLARFADESPPNR